MNLPAQEDLNREERAALRHLREQVRQQQRAKNAAAKKEAAESQTKQEKDPQ
jgi:hypothetical protein